MSSYADRAEALFSRGFNCAQAVFVPFAEDAGMDVKTALRVAASLGGGLGHAGEVCGAVLGKCLAVGLAKGYDSDPSMDTKLAQNDLTKSLVDAFRAEFGHTGCDDLRVPGDRTPCIAFVRRAAELAEEAARAGV